MWLFTMHRWAWVKRGYKPHLSPQGPLMSPLSNTVTSVRPGRFPLTPRRRQSVRRYHRGQRRDSLGEHHIVHIYIHAIWHTHTHTQVHGCIPWILKSVIKKVGYGTSRKYTKYTNLQCKYYKYFTITAWYIICTHKQFIYRAKAVCI